MPKREDFPIWTRNRARRYFARGVSDRTAGLILRPGAGRSSEPAEAAGPTNVLPFRPLGTLPAFRSGSDRRHG